LKERVAKARRTARSAAVVVFLLALGKAIAGLLAGSAALLADALHSAADLLALGSSWFGLFLASRKPTERFPYGFYRAETFAALLGSVIILYLGGSLLHEGIFRITQAAVLARPGLAMLVAAASIVSAGALSRWERRVSIDTGSQSLAATADEARVDIYTSLLVFVSVSTSSFGIPYLEGIATVLISAVVLIVGLKNGWVALQALMDASVDPGLEREVKSIIDEIPGVRNVESIRARRSGPYYFIEGHVQVAGSMDVSRSHSLSHQAQRAIGERRADVEGVILHIEPYRSSFRKVLVPIQSPDGLLSRVEAHFGRAPWFVLATLRDKNVVGAEIEDNPFARKDVRAGLAVVNKFVRDRKLDAILVKDIGEIAFHALRDNGVEILRSGDGTVEQSLKDFVEMKLDFLSEPTHSSEKKLIEGKGSDEDLREVIETKLSEIIDPGAGLDVFRMGLIRELIVKDGNVCLVFRPSSPVCPMAFSLAPAIKEAIESIPGVKSVDMRVQNFNRASELQELLKSQTRDGSAKSASDHDRNPQ